MDFICRGVEEDIRLIVSLNVCVRGGFVVYRVGLGFFWILFLFLKNERMWESRVINSYFYYNVRIMSVV